MAAREETILDSVRALPGLAHRPKSGKSGARAAVGGKSGAPAAPAIADPKPDARSGDPKPGRAAAATWREAAAAVDFSPRPAHPKVHDFERSVLPSVRTLKADYDVRLCAQCQRPLIASAMAAHVAACHKKRRLSVDRKPKKLKKEKDDEKDEVKGVKEEKEVKKEEKKDDQEKGEKEKRGKGKAQDKVQDKPQEKEKKPRKPKQTRLAKDKDATYTPDRHCGVPLPKTGLPCMRSLTCKQHPMGAKRAVPGRTAPYDVLLTQYHQQQTQLRAQTANAAAAAQQEWDEQQESQAQANPAKEVAQVVESAVRSAGAPLAVGSVGRSSFRAQQFRLGEMLSMALLPRRLPPSGEPVFGRSLAFRPEAPDRPTYVRSQAVQQSVYLAQLQQLQQQKLKKAQASPAQAAQAAAAAAAAAAGLPPQTSLPPQPPTSLPQTLPSQVPQPQQASQPPQAPQPQTQVPQPPQAKPKPRAKANQKTQRVQTQIKLPGP